MNITLPYPPSANRYWRVWNGRAVKSDEAREYKHAVERRCLVARMEPLTGAVQVTVAVYRPRKSGDLDNSLKVLLDALKGHAYLDDKQVTRIVAEQHDDKAAPRVEVAVALRTAGVSDVEVDASDYERPANRGQQ